MTELERRYRESMNQVEQAQAVIAAEHGRTFERVSESGLRRVIVGLDGNLRDVIFFRNDVFGIEESSIVAQEVLATIKAARADAFAEAVQIVERFAPPE